MSYQKGDILVFKAGDHWLSKSIALLTNSDVSHAAMIYEDSQVVEMELPGIQLSTVTIKPGEGAYLMRLDPEMEGQPLIDAAKVYLDAKTRYDIPALVILGGLLIYRKVRVTPQFVLVADLILRAACRALDQLIQTVILHHPDQAMVCSQLVYQIYHDCGKDYHIRLEGGTFQGVQKEAGKPVSPEFVRIKDMIALRGLSDQMKQSQCDADDSDHQQDEDPQWQILQGIPGVAAEGKINMDDPEQLAQLLVGVIQAQQNGDLLQNQMGDMGPLIKSAKELIRKLEKLLELTKADIPIDALFVTPADFLNHSKNLRRIGEFYVTKNNDNHSEITSGSSAVTT